MRSLAVGHSAGAEVAAHTHRWHQLIYAVAGVMTVWTAQGSWVTPPHWAIWVPAGVHHALRFAGATSLRTLYFRPEARSRQTLPAACGVIGVSALLRELVLRAIEIGQLDRRRAEHRALALLLRTSLLARPKPPFELPRPQSPDLQRLTHRLETQPADQATSSALAAQAGLGLRTLERRFRAECGLSFDHWRRRARFAHALRELAAGRAVKVVAEECGYRSASAFVAAFRAEFGQTPGAYFGS